MSKWNDKWLRLDCYHPSLNALAVSVERFCSRWVYNHRPMLLLVLAGDSGTGKTHSAKAIHRFATAASMSAYDLGHWRNGPPDVSYCAWAEFIDAESSMWERQLIETSMAILDDVGSESDRYRSGASVDRLCRILSARDGKSTVITTNLGVEEWAARDKRVADRLLRGSDYVKIEGVQSWALRNKQTKQNGKA
jgi:DNA replication protein DnaC